MLLKHEAQRCGDEAKALPEKTVQTSQSQNFLLQIYIITRQNEILASKIETPNPRNPLAAFDLFAVVGACLLINS